MGKIRTVDMTAVEMSLPIDRVAVRGVLPGVHYVAERKNLEEGRADYRSRKKPMKIWRDSKYFEIRQQIRKFTGKQFGKWTVFGYARHQPSGKKGANWVVKCSCGRYEMRKMRALERAEVTGDCCWECKDLQAKVRRYDHFKNKVDR